MQHLFVGASRTLLKLTGGPTQPGPVRGLSDPGKCRARATSRPRANKGPAHRHLHCIASWRPPALTWPGPELDASYLSTAQTEAGESFPLRIFFSLCSQKKWHILNFLGVWHTTNCFQIRSANRPLCTYWKPHLPAGSYLSVSWILGPTLSATSKGL